MILNVEENGNLKISKLMQKLNKLHILILTLSIFDHFVGLMLKGLSAKMKVQIQMSKYLISLIHRCKFTGKLI